MKQPNRERLIYYSVLAVAVGIIVLAIQGLAILIGSQQQASAQTVTVTKTVIVPSPEERAMISLTNDYRVEAGLIDLTTNSQLMTSAQAKADDLCQAGNWAHTDSRGREFQAFIQDSGYQYDHAGENLARGQVDQPAAFQALLNSPSHLENIVGKYREIGVGFNDCEGNRYTVVHYGVRS